MPRTASRPTTRQHATGHPTSGHPNTGHPTTGHPTTTSRRSRAPRIQPTVPLGSLTQPGARGSACCAACGSDCVTSLRMTLTDGTPVSFTSCHRCEHRTWAEIDGPDLPVAKVLKKARKPR